MAGEDEWENEVEREDSVVVGLGLGMGFEKEAAMASNEEFDLDEWIVEDAVEDEQ